MTGEAMASPGSGEMFDAIAARYDAMNRILSIGVDQRWRRAAVHEARLGANARVLDVATGTADLALMVARTAKDAVVTGIDPSAKMLERGRAKVRSSSLDERVRLVSGDAQSLPFADETFDAALIAFGIRNVPDRPKALAEMARVTRRGGRVVVLELTEPTRGVVAAMARFHVHTLVPVLGSLLSGAREYRYLERSIAAFPPAGAFVESMEKSGLASVRAVPFTFGVATLFVGERPR